MPTLHYPDYSRVRPTMGRADILRLNATCDPHCRRPRTGTPGGPQMTLDEAAVTCLRCLARVDYRRYQRVRGERAAATTGDVIHLDADAGGTLCGYPYPTAPRFDMRGRRIRDRRPFCPACEDVQAAAFARRRAAERAEEEAEWAAEAAEGGEA